MSTQTPVPIPSEPPMALAVAERPATPLPAFGAADMRRAYAAYRELQRALDEAMPDQIITLGDKPFRKKGYWRAVAVAFNLDVSCVHEARVEHGEDWGWEVLYRAQGPSGRRAEGDGSCFASEKSKGRMTATEHNVRSHAHTRAFNRAIANLCGFGEVSAEEIDRDERGAQDDRPISDAQQRRLFVLAKDAGWTEDALRAYLFERYGLRQTKDIRRAQYDEICATVERPPAPTLPDQPF
jgi:hypothetical protein